MIQENLNIIITILLLNTSIIYFHKILIKNLIFMIFQTKRKFHETKLLFAAQLFLLI